MLELFNGKISLTELLNLEIPILNQLYEAKIDMIEKEMEEREKMKKKWLEEL